MDRTPSAFVLSAFVLSAILLSATLALAGCAARPQVTALGERGLRRIAIAQPSAMHHSVILEMNRRDHPAPAVYRQFCDALEATLREQGFVVIDHCSTPNTTVVSNVLPAPKVSAEDADVLLVPTVEIGYAPGSTYRLQARGAYTLIDVRTRATLESVGLGRSAELEAGAPTYASEETLLADRERLVPALKRAASDLGQHMGRSVK